MKKLTYLTCAGLLALSCGLAWAGGDGAGRDKLFEDTIRSLNDRIKQLEDQVNRLKAPPPPAPVAKKDDPGLANRLKALEDDFSLLRGLEVHGILSATYTYNLNRPRNDKNGLILFNEDDNTAALHLANIQVSHKSAVAGIGFLVDADFGETAEGVGRVTRWGDSFPNGSENDNFFELRQAYLTYTMPVGNGVSFKAGKFVTLHGAEVIKAWNNINYNISNSILFGYSIPFTHTGVMASYPINDFLSVDLGAVNGWDNVEDNNDGKSVHGAVTIKPHEMISLYIAGMFGPEQDDRGDSKRTLITTLITVKPMDRLTFILDHNWGHETDVCPRLSSGIDCLDGDLPNSAFSKSADWHGAAGYAIFNLTDQLTVALRGEWFSDMDGIRTGSGRRGQDFWEVTPTIAYTIADGLVARVEYRHDESSRHFYQSHCRNCFISGQDVVAGEILYAF